MITKQRGVSASTHGPTAAPQKKSPDPSLQPQIEQQPRDRRDEHSTAVAHTNRPSQNIRAPTPAAPAQVKSDKKHPFEFRAVTDFRNHENDVFIEVTDAENDEWVASVFRNGKDFEIILESPDEGLEPTYTKEELESAIDQAKIELGQQNYKAEDAPGNEQEGQVTKPR